MQQLRTLKHASQTHTWNSQLASFLAWGINQKSRNKTNRIIKEEGDVCTSNALVNHRLPAQKNRLLAPKGRVQIQFNTKVKSPRNAFGNTQWSQQSTSMANVVEERPYSTAMQWKQSLSDVETAKIVPIRVLTAPHPK